MSDAPAPLVSIEVDLRDFGFMPLEVLRLRDSDLAALATGDEFKAAVLLWCAAWHQSPAASLPNDDRLLARYSGAGASWKKVRDMALRGFVLCSDGRLYHEVIAEKANESWKAKLAQRERTRKATEERDRKRREAQAQRDGQRNEYRDDIRNVQRDVDRNVVQGTVKGQGQGQGIKEAATPPARDPRFGLVYQGLERILSHSAFDGSRIHAWLAAGADPELDIFPAVRRVHQRNGTGPPKSLKYFDGAIADALATRTRALPPGTPETARTATSSRHEAVRQACAAFDAYASGNTGENQRDHPGDAPALPAAAVHR